MPSAWRLAQPRLNRMWNMLPWNASQQLSHQQPPTPQNVQHIVLKHKYVVALFLFLVCVDLIEIVGVLCYQLFTASYFPWHLYPMMLNRAMEIIALICSRGYVPSLYSAAQILLSLLSLAIYAKRQPCGKYRCAVPLVLYSILLSYETFVAVMVIKVSRMPMADEEGQIIANWPTFQVSPVSAGVDHQHQGLQPIIMRLSPRVIRERIIGQTVNQEDVRIEASTTTNVDKSFSFHDATEVIVAVQQPDGEKVHMLAIAKVCENTQLQKRQDAASSEAMELVSTATVGEQIVVPQQNTSRSLREVMRRTDDSVNNNNAHDGV